MDKEKELRQKLQSQQKIHSETVESLQVSASLDHELHVHVHVHVYVHNMMESEYIGTPYLRRLDKWDKFHCPELGPFLLPQGISL